VEAAHDNPVQPGSQSVPAAAASQEVPLAAPNSNRPAPSPARSSLAQKQLTSGTKSGKLKVPAIKAPDDSVPLYDQQPANANRSSASAVHAGAHASTQQQPTATGKNSRVAAPGSNCRRQPGGGNKGRAPTAKRGAPLHSPPQQQHTAASNRSSASGISKAAAQHTSAAPAARHSQSKAGVQSSRMQTRSNLHSAARPAAQKQPPAAAWKTQSQTAAQHSDSTTTRRQQSSLGGGMLSSGGPSSTAQPSQPGQGPSGPMSYVKAARSGVPQEQDPLLVMDRVPMDDLVFPYVSSERDSAEEQRSKQKMYDSLMELATGRHQIRSCRHIAGKLLWSCCLLCSAFQVVFDAHMCSCPHCQKVCPIIYCRFASQLTA